jgi:hypothetical protein
MTFTRFLDLMLLRTLGIHQARACRAGLRTPEVTARHRAVLPRIQSLRQWLLRQPAGWQPVEKGV